jgi:hypothetical protein
MIIECIFTRPLAGGSAFRGRGGPSPALKGRTSEGESFGIHSLREMSSFNP